ncbi:hypothetical protein TKK_0009101 [Trichogramma kaykai]
MNSFKAAGPPVQLEPVDLSVKTPVVLQVPRYSPAALIAAAASSANCRKPSTSPLSLSAAAPTPTTSASSRRTPPTPTQTITPPSICVSTVWIEISTIVERSCENNRTTPWFRDKALDRFHIVTVNRMRSDHHSLAESLHRKNIVADPGCRCGLATESLNHAIWQCDLYDRHRGALWRALSGLGLRRPLNIESIIAAPNIQACVAVCDFLRRCSLRV